MLRCFVVLGTVSLLLFCSCEDEKQGVSSGEGGKPGVPGPAGCGAAFSGLTGLPAGGPSGCC